MIGLADIASGVRSFARSFYGVGVQAADVRRDTQTTGIPPYKAADLERRQVEGQTSEFYMFQPELSVMQVRGLLYSGMQGNFYAAYDLFSVMQDTSPRLLINLHQMREMASRAKVKVHPFRVGDRKPTARAVERAQEIDWMLKQWRPDPNADELGMSGLVYEVLGAMVQPTMCELQYHMIDNRWCPRAATWIIPRKYVFDRESGRLGVGNVPGLDDARSPSTEAGKVLLLSPLKHVLSVYQTRSAAMTLSGLVRPLPFWWTAAMYGRKWLLRQAERFGVPFPHITYELGTPQSAIRELQAMANNFAASGSAVTLDTMAIKFIEHHFDPRENPNNWLVEKFDYYCDLVILRETRASDIGRSSTGNRGGSAQAGEMRASQTEAVEALTAFSDGVLTAQLVRNLCLLNYGDEEDMPHIETSFAQPESPKDDAKTVFTLSQAGLDADPEEMSEKFGMKLVRQAISGQLSAVGRDGKDGKKTAVGGRPEREERGREGNAAEILPFDCAQGRLSVPSFGGIPPEGRTQDDEFQEGEIGDGD